MIGRDVGVCLETSSRARGFRNTLNTHDMDWYYTRNQEQQGPVTEADLGNLLQAGTISAETLVWRDGMPDWKPLSTARPDLFGGSAALVGKDFNVQAMREGATNSMLPGQFHYAGFWIRFAAKFIDGILMQIVLIPVQMLLQGSIGLSGGSSPDAMQSFALAGLFVSLAISIIVPLLYNGFMIGKYGATLGKMACGLKVVMPDGSPVSTGRAFGRYLAEIVSGLILYIGYIMAGFDDEKRALHDHIASTRVIRIR